MRRNWRKIGAMTVAVALGMSFAYSLGSPGPGSACESEFRRVAAIDDFNDTVTDLDEAVRVCESLEVWNEMAADYPTAVEPEIAEIFLRNRCASGIASALCSEVRNR